MHDYQVLKDMNRNNGATSNHHVVAHPRGDEGWAELTYLNLSALWPYFSLLSALNYYMLKLPDAGLSFAITVVVTWPMVVAQALQVTFQLNKRLGFTPRVVGGFSIFTAVAVVFIVQDLLPLSPAAHTAIILLLTAVVGLTNTLTESVLYGMAGLFPDSPHLTHGIQVGNGVASNLNVWALTLIRLGMLAKSDGRGSARGEQVAYYAFMGFQIAVSLIAIAVFMRLRRMPFMHAEIERQRLSHQQQATAPSAPPWGLQQPHIDGERGGRQSSSPVQWLSCGGGRLRDTARICLDVWRPAVAVFVVHTTSLLLFPGVPCSAPPSGVFASCPAARLWFCSPLIVGSYSLGDLLGRWVTGPRVLSALSPSTCLGVSLGRALLLPLLVALGVRPLLLVRSPWYQAVLMLVLGTSNGLLGTVAMCQGPALVRRERDREAGAYVMVMALYLGLATGATVAFAAQRWVE